MTCIRRKCDFCWLCGEKIDGGTNPRHFNETDCNQFDEGIETFEDLQNNVCFLSFLCIVMTFSIPAAFVISGVLWILVIPIIIPYGYCAKQDHLPVEDRWNYSTVYQWFFLPVFCYINYHHVLLF
eukprot:UN05463